jgi:hypothetical protein
MYLRISMLKWNKPGQAEDKIELRVAWLIDIPQPVSYKIFVDAM